MLQQPGLPALRSHTALRERLWARKKTRCKLDPSCSLLARATLTKPQLILVAKEKVGQLLLYNSNCQNMLHAADYRGNYNLYRCPFCLIFFPFVFIIIYFICGFIWYVQKHCLNALWGKRQHTIHNRWPRTHCVLEQLFSITESTAVTCREKVHLETIPMLPSQPASFGYIWLRT